MFSVVRSWQGKRQELVRADHGPRHRGLDTPMTEAEQAAGGTVAAVLTREEIQFILDDIRRANE